MLNLRATCLKSKLEFKLFFQALTMSLHGVLLSVDLDCFKTLTLLVKKTLKEVMILT